LIELLENMDVLKSSSLRLDDLALAGVPYGCAEVEFPTNQVTQVTLAPIIKSSSWTSSEGAKYKDDDGRELALGDVIRNAFSEGGILHFASKVSFRISEGRVTGFAIFGSQLEAFRSIRSQEQLVREFGKPDLVQPNEAYGDLMGYFNFYDTPKRWVSWDDWQKRIAGVSVGFPRSV